MRLVLSRRNALGVTSNGPRVTSASSDQGVPGFDPGVARTMRTCAMEAEPDPRIPFRRARRPPGRASTGGVGHQKTVTSRGLRTTFDVTSSRSSRTLGRPGSSNTTRASSGGSRGWPGPAHTHAPRLAEVPTLRNPVRKQSPLTLPILAEHLARTTTARIGEIVLFHMTARRLRDHRSVRPRPRHDRGQ